MPAPAVRCRADAPAGISGLWSLAPSRPWGGQRAWLDAQKRLAGLSTRGEQRVIATATKESLLEADAAASSDAILDVVRSVREE